MAMFDVDTTDYMELRPTVDRQPTKKVVPISIMELAGDCYCRILFSDESQVFYSPHSQQQMIEWSDISRRNSLALATWRIVPMSALRRVQHAGMDFHDWEYGIGLCRRPTAQARASHNEAVRDMIKKSRTP